MLRRRRRAEKVAALLEFNAHSPSRALLVADVLAKGVQNQVLPELRGLYQRVELDFAPLQARALVRSFARLVVCSFGRLSPLVSLFPSFMGYRSVGTFRCSSRCMISVDLTDSLPSLDPPSTCS